MRIWECPNWNIIRDRNYDLKEFFLIIKPTVFELVFMDV